jgi:hypothetical protein
MELTQAMETPDDKRKVEIYKDLEITSEYSPVFHYYLAKSKLKTGTGAIFSGSNTREEAVKRCKDWIDGMLSNKPFIIKWK